MIQFSPEVLNSSFVVRVCRADESIIADLGFSSQIIELLHSLVAEELGVCSSLPGCALNLQAMLVCAGEQDSTAMSAQQSPSFENVCENKGVQMTDVRSYTL